MYKHLEMPWVLFVAKHKKEDDETGIHVDFQLYHQPVKGKITK